jgi:ribosomal subunit interface protein
MNITFKTHNLELTPDIRSYAEEKASAVRKVLGHHEDSDIDCDVVLSRDDKHATGLIYRADISAFAGKEKVHAVGHGMSITAAIDLAKDELLRRATHDKTKRLTLLRRGRAKVKEWMRFGR